MQKQHKDIKTVIDFLMTLECHDKHRDFLDSLINYYNVNGGFTDKQLDVLKSIMISESI